ncbi:hypothetical protein [Pseudomonas chlororaphis]|uniref:hypothetical protein n=1 Tax=Pseudomonas chlororaphis TaxID=587753 RepID=UPI000F573686|nr:hypothetical protein [Pseudomonas chlororaphis]
MSDLLLTTKYTSFSTLEGINAISGAVYERQTRMRRKITWKIASALVRAINWSSGMQLGGQVECKRVVK